MKIKKKRLASYWSPAHNLANPARPERQKDTNGSEFISVGEDSDFILFCTLYTYG